MITISLPSSALSFGVGQDFVFQPTATLTAGYTIKRWALSPTSVLPLGTFFSTSNGTISGSATQAGVFNVSMTAFEYIAPNGAEQESAVASFVLGFFNVPLTTYAKTATIDLKTLLVTFTETTTTTATTPPVSVRIADDLLWSLKFTSGTDEVNPSISMVQFALRKDDASPVIFQTDVTAYKGGMSLAGGLYYPEHFVHLVVGGDEIGDAVLENISESGTYADFLGEFQIHFAPPSNASGPKTLRTTTKAFSIRINRDMVDSIL